MKAYIASSTAISAGNTFEPDLFFNTAPHIPETGVLPVQEPDYKIWITNATLRRRMSRIIKMGVAASLKCMSVQPDIQPGAIISATGMGGLSDTEKFLNCLIDNNEQLLNPTQFIQSTGNTFGGQIGLILGNHNYNVTYVHGGLSVESALTDALMQIDEEETDQLMVTAAEERTGIEEDATRRLGFWRNGSRMGEGAQAFWLTAQPLKEKSVCLEGVRMQMTPTTPPKIMQMAQDLLNENHLKAEDIDLLLTGAHFDAPMQALMEQIYGQKNVCHYKRLCGEYMTASGFGLWLGTQMIERQVILTADQQWQKSSIKHVLLYTECLKDNYTLMLLSQAK